MSQITCATVGLPVGRESSSCLWLCCSDGFGGQVCILDLQESTQPQVVANITVSDSPILSVAPIPTKFGSDVRPLVAAAMSPKREGVEKKGDTEKNTLLLGPTISITSVTSSESRNSSNSSMSPDGHVTMSRDSSISSIEDAITISKTESHVGLENGNGTVLQNGHVSVVNSPRKAPDIVEQTLRTMAKQRKHGDKLSSPNIKSGFRRVRSNSAPSFPDAQTIAQEVSKIIPSPLVGPGGGQGPKRSESTSRLWSPLSLLLSDLDIGDGGRDHCMWLGTEAGQILIYSAGSNLRSRSNRECLSLPASIHCIRLVIRDSRLSLSIYGPIISHGRASFQLRLTT